jgi:Arc/MetJ-type ribon-helix-helix transcriptional regulator
MEASVVRTQVQLTERQARLIRELASRRGVSISEVVREAVDALATAEALPSADQRRQRALAAAGRFRSENHDVARRHDDYLADAYRSTE